MSNCLDSKHPYANIPPHKQRSRNNRRLRNKEQKVAIAKMEKHGTCCLCNDPITRETMTIEHIYPVCSLKNAKELIPENIEAACSRCNGAKNDRTVEEYVGYFVPKMKSWLQRSVIYKHFIPSEKEILDFIFSKMHHKGRLVKEVYLRIAREEIARLLACSHKQPAD